LKIKTEIKNTYKNHKRLFLLWPAVLTAVLFLQIGAAVWLKAFPKTENKSPDVLPVPTVLGATSDLRGQAVLKPEKMVIPFVSNNDLAGISAKSFTIYDQGSGEVVLEKNSSQKLPIASLTKLMTGLLAYDYLDFNKKITITKQGLTNVSPTVNFLNNDQVLIGDVFNSMIVGSCNDAAQILADEIETVTGQNIAALMNKRAADLGMTESNFSNPLGFDIGPNYSTAGDLKKLADKTESYGVFSNLGLKTNLIFSGSLGFTYQVKSTNTLLKKYPDIQAVKTGYTENAKGSMIVKISKGNHNLIIIVLNSQDREGDVLKLKSLVVDKLQWL
jgi:D-alanyl-D-alanine carboxypeptidase